MNFVKTSSSLLFLLLIPLYSFTGVHKFYVSVTEVEYVPKKKSLQIISRVFVDDFQEVIQKRYQKTFDFVGAKKEPEADVYIQQYFQEKFKLSVGKRNLNLNFIGKRYEDDLLICYFEVENLANFTTIEITNLVLTDLFEEQKNLVHITQKNKTKSLVLVKDRPTDQVDF